MYHYLDFWYYTLSLCYGKFKKRLGKNKNQLRTTYPKNHENIKNSKPRVQFYWFLQRKRVSQKVSFPYLKQVKASFKYPKYQMSLIIMDTFKGQDNYAILDLCQKRNSPHNHTNRFQPLDIPVNRPAKSFISSK